MTTKPETAVEAKARVNRLLPVIAVSGLFNGVIWAVISSNYTADGMGALAVGYLVLAFYSPVGCAWGLTAAWCSGRLTERKVVWGIVGALNLLQGGILWLHRSHGRHVIGRNLARLIQAYRNANLASHRQLGHTVRSTRGLASRSGGIALPEQPVEL